MHCIYLRSCGKVFSQVYVKNSVHSGGVSLNACWDTLRWADIPRGRHPPLQTPPRQTPPGQILPGQTPPRADTPRQRTPRQTPPTTSPHPSTPDGHCNRQYASYWNAFLLRFVFIVCSMVQVGVCTLRFQCLLWYR